jgi:hypothetical protein
MFRQQKAIEMKRKLNCLPLILVIVFFTIGCKKQNVPTALSIQNPAFLPCTGFHRAMPSTEYILVPSN